MASEIEIYKTPDNQTEIPAQIEGDTVWLSQKQQEVEDELTEKLLRSIKQSRRDDIIINNKHKQQTKTPKG
jgi:hypothetical protein